MLQAMVRQKQKRQNIQTNEDCRSVQYDIGENTMKSKTAVLQM